LIRHAQVDIPPPTGQLRQYQPQRDPHAYAIAHFAYYSAVQDKQNQSCIVSGESGAGKTVACKYLMAYLAVLSSRCALQRGSGSSSGGGGGGGGGVGGGDDGGDGGGSGAAVQVSVEEKVIACSPFLEAFGNACTPMNDNSSRFGKYLKIFFDKGVMVGGKMEHYLLEKARVASQGVDSRNFHIFYFLVKGAGE
jgi:myosin heavy subunit